MSTARETSAQVLDFETASREQMAQTIGLLMRVRGVVNRKALASDLAPYGMSQSTVYSRLSRSTDWQATELRALGAALRVPPSAFFCPADPEILAPIIGLSVADFVKTLVEGAQNWKKLTADDLHVHVGGGSTVSRQVRATRPQQLRFRHLSAVPTDPHDP